MKFLILISFPFILQAQKTVEVQGYLKIDSLRACSISDTLLAINNNKEVVKTVAVWTLMILHRKDWEIMGMYNPAEGLLVYDLDLHKLFIFTGANWEMINSITKFE